MQSAWSPCAGHMHEGDPWSIRPGSRRHMMVSPSSPGVVGDCFMPSGRGAPSSFFPDLPCYPVHMPPLRTHRVWPPPQCPGTWGQAPRVAPLRTPTPRGLQGMPLLWAPGMGPGGSRSRAWQGLLRWGVEVRTGPSVCPSGSGGGRPCLWPPVSQEAPTQGVPPPQSLLWQAVEEEGW